MHDALLYRATVVYSDQSTGEITVKIPSLSGFDSVIPLSYIGRTSYNGTWKVPAIGSQIIVGTSDVRLNNVYWLQVQPSIVDSELNNLQNQIDTLEEQTSGLQLQVLNANAQVGVLKNSTESDIQDIHNELDALMLGIF